MKCVKSKSVFGNGTCILVGPPAKWKYRSDSVTAVIHSVIVRFYSVTVGKAQVYEVAGQQIRTELTPRDGPISCGLGALLRQADGRCAGKWGMLWYPPY